ncbi:MAG: hypothetical protein NXI01_06720 [Gammaproteobacteria bacterium]|nr:hypothetical protein [Gammaproteobacteria bacterium]
MREREKIREHIGAVSSYWSWETTKITALVGLVYLVKKEENLEIMGEEGLIPILVNLLKTCVDLYKRYPHADIHREYPLTNSQDFNVELYAHWPLTLLSSLASPLEFAFAPEVNFNRIKETELLSLLPSLLPHTGCQPAIFELIFHLTRHDEENRRILGPSCIPSIKLGFISEDVLNDQSCKHNSSPIKALGSLALNNENQQYLGGGHGFDFDNLTPFLQCKKYAECRISAAYALSSFTMGRTFYVSDTKPGREVIGSLLKDSDQKVKKYGAIIIGNLVRSDRGRWVKAAEMLELQSIIGYAAQLKSYRSEDEEIALQEAAAQTLLTIVTTYTALQQDLVESKRSYIFRQCLDPRYWPPSEACKIAVEQILKIYSSVPTAEEKKVQDAKKIEDDKKSKVRKEKTRKREEEIQTERNRLRQSWVHGNFVEILQGYKNLINEEPNASINYFERGSFRLYQAQLETDLERKVLFYEKAKQDFDQTLTFNPGDGQARAGKSQAVLSLEELATQQTLNLRDISATLDDNTAPMLMCVDEQKNAASSAHGRKETASSCHGRSQLTLKSDKVLSRSFRNNLFTLFGQGYQFFVANDPDGRKITIQARQPLPNSTDNHRLLINTEKELTTLAETYSENNHGDEGIEIRSNKKQHFWAAQGSTLFVRQINQELHSIIAEQETSQLILPGKIGHIAKQLF